MFFLRFFLVTIFNRWENYDIYSPFFLLMTCPIDNYLLLLVKTKNPYLTTHFFTDLGPPTLQMLPPFHFDVDADSDPDPACHFNAYPDPAFHFDPDPDPDPASENDADPDPQHWCPGTGMSGSKSATLWGA